MSNSTNSKPLAPSIVHALCVSEPADVVAWLWDMYLSDYPADPEIEHALSVLDPNWCDDVDPPEGYDMLCPAN